MDRCVIMGIERVTPMLKCDACGVEFQARGLRREFGDSVHSNTVTTVTPLQGVSRRIR